jgi:co-chaperonin GroES (HSP10)|tara:strand:+ start:461 stop:757 length:297 start_codon:yes stop_codon:yes gene_type:complete
MSKVKAQGDFIIVEKVDYDEEKVSEGGIIYKESQILSSSFVEAKIISMGSGLPISNGDIPKVKFKEDDIILYDARSRIGTHDDFDVIRREHIIAIMNK